MEIDGHRIADDTDCYVIAEIGHNHQGNLKTALEMIKVAKECGADAVKFQKRDNKTLYTEEFYNKPYENENSFGKTYGEHREALEFGQNEYEAIRDYSKELDITWFATAFDIQSADFLNKLGVNVFKLASGDLTNHPLMKHIAKFGKPMIVSTGGHNIGAVMMAYELLIPLNPDLCLLQATCSYPCAFEELNLNVIRTYKEKFPKALVGLSSHDNGIAMAVVAYTLGARVIEKHFTLNRAMKGTDHAFSLEPVGLRKLVRDLRRAKVAMGDGIKKQFESEKTAIYKMGKSIYATKDLPATSQITPDNVAVQSPGGGLQPYYWDRLTDGWLTKINIRPIRKGEQILFKDLI